MNLKATNSIGLAFLVFLVSALLVSASESQKCDKGWREAKWWNLCLYISNTTLSWEDALVSCQNKSSNLVVVKSKDKNKQIVKQLQEPSEYYIGLYRKMNATSKWTSGVAMEVNYTNWRFPNETSKEPVNGQLCGFYGIDNKWAFDTNCTTKRRFICQKRKTSSSSSGNGETTTPTTENKTQVNPSSYPTKPSQSTGLHGSPRATFSTTTTTIEEIAESMEDRINRLKGQTIGKNQANKELENLKNTLVVKPENMSASDISKVVEEIEGLGAVLIEGMKKNGSIDEAIKIQVSSDVLVLDVTVMPPKSNSAVQFRPQAGSGGSINVPGSVIETVEKTPGNSDGVGVTSVFLPGVGKGDKSNAKKPPYLNSGVISTKFYVPEETLKNLTNPVVIFLPLEQTLKEGERPACVFIDPKSSKYSTKGCKVAASNSTHVVCHCTHLTSFAVLLDVHGNIDKTPDEHKFVLLIVSIVGCCIALLCFIAALIAFQFVIAERLRRKTETISIHKNLAIAEIFALTFFLIAYAVGEPKGLCFAVTFLLHYSLMSVFLWMLVEGLNLHRGTVQVFMTTSRLKVYYILGWGTPLVFVIPTAAFGQMEYMRKDFCWISKDLIWAFAGPVAVILFINFIILCIAIRVMIKRPRYKANKVDDSNNVKAQQELRIAFRTTVILLPLLGLTWCLGFLATHSVTGNIIIQYVFAIINTLQGLYFFLAHCLYDEDVKKATNNTSTRIKTYFSRSISRSNPSTSTSNRTCAYSSKPYNGGNVNLFEIPSAFSATASPRETSDPKNTTSPNGDISNGTSSDPKPRSSSESDSENCFKEVSLVVPNKPLTTTNNIPGEYPEDMIPNDTKEKPLDVINGDVGSPSAKLFRRAKSAIVKFSEKKNIPRRSQSLSDPTRLKLAKQTSIDSNHSGTSNTRFFTG